MGEEKGTNLSGNEDEDEEPGEVIESAPPLKVGEERELNNSGLKKKLLKQGRGWETPEFNDEVTVHYVGALLDGTKFDSTRDRDAPVTLKLGRGEVVAGLDHGIITMKKGECALFTVPPDLGYGVTGHEAVPPNSVVQFVVELVSWITVVNVTKDSGIVKKIMEKGQSMECPGDLDEVLVKYEVALSDGTIVSKTPEEGIEFCVKDGHLCAAFSKAIVTMRRGEKVKLIVQPKYAFGDEGKDTGDGIHLVPPNAVLNLDLELVSFMSVVDVTGDAKVLKKILKEGEGTLVASEGATVNDPHIRCLKKSHGLHCVLGERSLRKPNFRSVGVSYKARLQDGAVFENKGVDGKQPFQFITDEEQVISGLDRAAATMKKGEKAMLSISPEYGFGSLEVQRDLATVPPSSVLVYEVEMLDFIKEKVPWEMDDQEKIEAAARKKEEGNLLFKSGRYQRAGKKYDKAVDYVAEEGSCGNEEQKLVKTLRMSCWLNGAACSLKLNDLHGAINLCSKVLDIESANVKALYRRAQAYMQTGDLFSAELDVKKALEVDAQNREMKSLQKTLKQLKAECDKRDAKLYSNMFSCMTDTSVVTKKLKVEKADNEKKDEEVASVDMENMGDSSAPPNKDMVLDFC